MNRSKTAQDLSTQLTLEKKADIWIISEPYQKVGSPGWFFDTLGTAAIWIPDMTRVHVEEHGQTEGFVWIRTEDMVYVSGYLTPNEPRKHFKRKLDNIENIVRGLGEKVVIAGDLNARAIDWGMPNADSRGKEILEMAARMDLCVINTGNVRTFRRRGQKGTIPDITLSTYSVEERIIDWQVLEDFTGSDHQYISFAVAKERPSNFINTLRTVPRRWNLRKLDRDKFADVMQNNVESILQYPYGQVEVLVRDSVALLHQACDAAMPKTSYKNKRSVYWWTKNIATLRKECVKLRRQSQRSRKKCPSMELHERYKAVKKLLREAIRRSKYQKWQEIVNEVDKDP